MAAPRWPRSSVYPKGRPRRAARTSTETSRGREGDLRVLYAFRRNLLISPFSDDPETLLGSRSISWRRAWLAPFSLRWLLWSCGLRSFYGPRASWKERPPHSKAMKPIWFQHRRFQNAPCAVILLRSKTSELRSRLETSRALRRRAGLLEACKSQTLAS